MKQSKAAFRSQVILKSQHPICLDDRDQNKKQLIFSADDQGPFNLKVRTRSPGFIGKIVATDSQLQIIEVDNMVRKKVVFQPSFFPQNTIFGLKMIVKRGLEKIFLKFLHARNYFP